MVSGLWGYKMIKSAMILAAGLGLRMRPLTNYLPKPLISVAGKSMLERAFNHLKSIGVSKIVVNTHHLAPLVEQKVKELDSTILISHEEILLETGGGIKKALPWLGNEAFFILNGDNVWSHPESLTHMEKVWDEAKMDALLLLIPHEKAHGYEGKGDFLMSKEGRLSRLNQTSLIPFVYIGVQLASPRLFQHAPEGPFSLNLLWDRAIQDGRLFGYIHQGECFHISTPADLQKYEPIVANLER